MTSMYTPSATVPTAIAAPTVAATVPTTTVMAPPMVQAAPSFVAPPVAMPQFAAQPPVSLTAGLVDPAKLDAERQAYEKALDAQLKKQSDAVAQEAEIKKQMLKQAAETQIKQMELQLDERLKMSALQVDQEAANVVTGLHEAAIQQRTAMEERVAIAQA